MRGILHSRIWRQVIAFTYLISLFAFPFLVTEKAYGFSGVGAGTEESPYIITTCVQLQEMDDELDAFYELGANIDCSDTENWNSGAGFDPVGTFTGSFDGSNYIIENLTINRPSTSSVGLFGYNSGGTITNAHVLSSFVAGRDYVGGIVGYMDDGVVNHSSFNITSTDHTCATGDCVQVGSSYGGGVIGYIEGDLDVNNIASSGGVNFETGQSPYSLAGLIGYQGFGVVLTDSYTSATVNTVSGESGGAIGALDTSAAEVAVQRVYSTGDLTSTYSVCCFANAPVGGLIGYIYGGSIADTYATGDVTSTGGGIAGGLVGNVNSANVDRSYSTGAVNQGAAWASGGLVAQMNAGSTYEITDSFTASEVNSTSTRANNFVGELNDNHGAHTAVVDGYYDIDATGKTFCYEDNGTDYDDGCTKINAGNSDPSYFFDSSNPPFNDGSQVWSLDTWEFSGTDYPTLECQGGQCGPDLGALDYDSDGISNDDEDAAPNGGDANNDGTKDYLQDNVASMVSSKTGEYVTLVAPAGSSITSIDTSSNDSDSDYEYILGLTSFTITGLSAGATAEMNLLYHNNQTDAELLTARKYYPSTTSFADIPEPTIENIIIDNTPVVSLTFSITDGGDFDLDGSADGSITDPVGLGTEREASDETLADTGINTAYLTIVALFVLASGVILRKKTLA